MSSSEVSTTRLCSQHSTNEQQMGMFFVLYTRPSASIGHGNTKYENTDERNASNLTRYVVDRVRGHLSVNGRGTVIDHCTNHQTLLRSRLELCGPSRVCIILLAPFSSSHHHLQGHTKGCRWSVSRSNDSGARYKFLI